ncbi:MAG: class C sortase [Oscillospiraceae bacterium]|nr:class C sortase [Oscillospiraceae bacterium]
MSCISLPRFTRGREDTAARRVLRLNRNRIITIILIIAFFAGLCLLLYPKVSDYWNSFHQTRAITQYVSKFEEMDEEAFEGLLKEAEEYNASLPQRRVSKYILSDAQAEEYSRLLNITGDGMMGYIEIPVIGVSLPVFHGASGLVLQSAVGHLEWTSLPVGGESTHCVLTGHRGLPSSRLLTDLDRLVEGDIFVIKVLNRTLTYEVDQILIVEPKNTAPLDISPGEDYCTLITCTPYAVNTHRILVRGHRIESPEEAQIALVNANAVLIEPLLVAPVIFSVILLFVLLATMFIRGDRMNNKEERHEEE